MTPSKPANKEEPPWLILSSYSRLHPDINGLSRYQLLHLDAWDAPNPLGTTSLWWSFPAPFPLFDLHCTAQDSKFTP